MLDIAEVFMIRIKLVWFGGGAAAAGGGDGGGGGSSNNDSRRVQTIGGFTLK